VGEESTLENSQHTDVDTEEAKRHLQEDAINREEARLHALEQLEQLHKIVGQLMVAQYSQQHGKVVAVGRAFKLLRAFLEDDDEMVKMTLDSLAFHLGYRIKDGAFDN